MTVLHSSKKVEWPTPDDLFAELDREYGPFTLDVAATADNAKCPRFYTQEDDGLARPWTGRVWCNPPYGKTIGLWIRKALESASNGDAELVVCLVPSRTGTAWWHEYAMKGDIRYFKGRFRFGGAESNAPFDSALIVFRNAKSVTKPAESEAQTEAA